MAAKPHMTPTIETVERLLPQAAAAAVRSPCAKSQRGVLIFRCDGSIVATGHNAQPPPFTCDGSEACRAGCGKLCVHAEVAALRGIGLARPADLHLLHVKVVHGVAVPSGPPSCWQCSREILATGIAAVWLLHEEGVCMYTSDHFHAQTLAHCGLPVLREGL